MHKSIIIIGASPSGLACGKYLAELDKEVLILEKNQIIGPKVCAGGLTNKDFTFNIPEELLEGSFDTHLIRTPHFDSVIKTEKPLVYTISRHKLGQWQAKQAIKAGAEIQTESYASKIKNNSIIVNNEEISFDYLVGADGSNSIVRRYLGLATEKVIMAMQYIINQSFKDMEWFLDNKYFGCGYGWIFPHGKYASIGCGCDMKSLTTKQLRENFEKWLKELNIELNSSKFEAHIINYDYRGYEFGNKFLIGDAGGFTSGLTGEGIYSGMVSGQEIAKSIIDENYNSKQLDELLATKQRHEKLLRIMEKSGWLRNLEFDLLGLLLRNKKFSERVVRLVE